MGYGSSILINFDMKNICISLFVFLSYTLCSQKNIEQFPVFKECEGKINTELENCFYNNVNEFFFLNFKTPQKVLDEKYSGVITILFEVNKEGKFIYQYADASNQELKQAIIAVFEKMPQVNAPTFSGEPTYARYTFKLAIPLKDPSLLKNSDGEVITEAQKLKLERNKINSELDSILYKKFDNPQYKSQLNIPFSHSLYAQFDAALNQMGNNNHTTSKPLTYSEVAPYYDFSKQLNQIKKNKTGWWGKKFWNENLVEIKGEDYWFTFNPLVDLRAGIATPSQVDYTYVNTRGILFQGGLGSKLNFTASIFESQGRFADYFNRLAESLRPDGGNPAIIPGIGIAKRFKQDAYDFPLADANLTFTPNKFINLQLGYSRNFIGDGYRSLLVNDAASPYPFVKINTTFWKIKYTNTYMWLKDVRPEVTEDRTYATKYMANHYLSWNVSNRLNIGFFESVIWTNDNNRGFDMAFVNPIIFYRAVEFTSSSRSGNAVLGLTSKYKLNNQINFYGQFILDEFSLNDIREGNKSWKNKFGYQIGAKYFNAFQIKNLLLQLEYNHVRPYVYSHTQAITNYGHNNQNIGHQWGGNFRELIAIARYFKGRYFADAKIIYGIRGLDFDTPENSFNYGGNIYKDYELDRPFDTGVKVGQGNETLIFIADIQAGYIVNPHANLRVFANVMYRNFNPNVNTITNFKESTTWVSFGIRSDIFNWYFDY